VIAHYIPLSEYPVIQLLLASSIFKGCNMTSKIKFYPFQADPKTSKQRILKVRSYLASALDTIESLLSEGKEISIKGGVNMNNFNTCDVCNKTSEKVVPGRWVFYCSDNPKCKQVDRDKTYDNEIEPDLESGDFSYILDQGLSDYVD
jgi:hypothetical protein